MELVRIFLFQTFIRLVWRKSDGKPCQLFIWLQRVAIPKLRGEFQLFKRWFHLSIYRWVHNGNMPHAYIPTRQIHPPSTSTDTSRNSPITQSKLIKTYKYLSSKEVKLDKTYQTDVVWNLININTDARTCQMGATDAMTSALEGRENVAKMITERQPILSENPNGKTNYHRFSDYFHIWPYLNPTYAIFQAKNFSTKLKYKICTVFLVSCLHILIIGPNSTSSGQSGQFLFSLLWVTRNFRWSKERQQTSRATKPTPFERSRII